MNPILLATNAARELLEVSWLRLIGANLLSGHNEAELKRQVAPRFAEQTVIDVGDQTGLELLGEAP